MTKILPSASVHIDLDGVLADFYGFARKILGKDFKDVPSALAWGRLSLVPHLFAQLDVLPGALDFFASLEHLGERRKILTAKPLPTGYLGSAERDKRDWVANNLSKTVFVNVVPRGVNKYKYGKPGDVLIDDQMRNLIPWEAHGGIAIHHTSMESTFEQLIDLGLLK